MSNLERCDAGQRLLKCVAQFLVWSILLTVCLGELQADDRSDSLPVQGDAVIRAPVGDSEIVITTTSRLAGAIHSLRWKDVEFIDSTDHGRQLQSASNFDAGSAFTPETFNPTEAGSVDDGAGPQSTSRLLHLIADASRLQTTSQMAFWLSPNGKSLGHPAKNTTKLSNHLLTKRVQIGYKDLPHVIQYDVTFSVPVGEKHTYAQFEVVTGYMPAKFKRFWTFNPESKELQLLTDGPGEQELPVIFSTADDKQYAMGILARDPTPPNMTGPGYGRFRFKKEKVVKWNCVYRLSDDKNGIAAADYSFRQFVIVGTLEDVKSAMVKLP